MTNDRACTLGIVLFVTAIAVGCTDSGPRVLNLNGTWSGSSAFGGTQSPTTTMTLTQNGTAISGTMRVTGAFLSLPITGQVDSEDRTLTWIVLDGCEAWGGVLNVSDDGTGMAGAVLVNRSTCTPAQQNSTGTMTLTKS